MKFNSTVDKIEDKGDSVEVTTTNVRGASYAEWREYSGPISFKVTHSQAKAFPIGRTVIIDIKPK